MPDIACLLWDFGDTLCDERFIWGSGPEWMAVYNTFDDDGAAMSWNTGDIDMAAFASGICRRLNLSPAEVINHMEARCRDIDYYEKTFAYFKSASLPQAIVTVNPDLFSHVIVPHYNLDQFCETIVTSWEEGTIDKRILNRIAIERLGLNCSNDRAMLIDNKQSNITDWVNIGGAGYLHVGDDAFAADFERGVPASA